MMKWVCAFAFLFTVGCSSQEAKNMPPVVRSSRLEDGAIHIVKDKVDGVSPQLKKDLSSFFEKYPGVQAAYLVEATSEDKKKVNACLIDLGKGEVNANLRTAVIDIFLNAKGSNFQVLHVVTVKDEMRKDLASNATPFYKKP